MKPHPAEERLALYAGADLETNESAEIAAHLRECAVCRAMAGDFENLARSLESAASEPASADLKSMRAAVMERIGRSRRTYQRLWLGTAAGFAAAIVIAILLFIPRSAPTVPATEAPVPVPDVPLLSREIPNLVLQRARRPERAGLRAAAWITRSDGSSQLKLTTGDPNVVILLPLSEVEVKDTHEN